MTQWVSVIFVDFTVIDTMAPALSCINAILVPRGQAFQCHESCFLSRLRSVENSKAIIDRHTVIVPLFAEEKHKMEKKKGGFAEFWSWCWRQIQYCVYLEHLRMDDITRASSLTSSTSQAVSIHTVVPLSGFISRVWLMLIFRAPVIVPKELKNLLLLLAACSSD